MGADIIHLLPDSVANQIAAGEVVQRPSSVVKELVENSIDAGAAHIQIVVEDGGRTLIQVIDDGKGMSETDARLAFERHATSKISSAADLYSLSTMGFRGEALASIVSVSQVELRTRRPDDELGIRLQFSGPQFEGQEYVTCPAGSNFSVRNLFFNVPARRRFLKTDSTELNNIIADFERIALVYPGVAFTLTSNHTEIYNLPSAPLKQRIIDVYGRKTGAELLPVKVDTPLINISGYVSTPESSKKKGHHQFFFVNGRYMRHPYFHSAVKHSYDNLVPEGNHVSYFLYLQVDPASIDVNVHPTKTEIKFDGEQDIWKVLLAAVRQTLGQYGNIPTLDFDTEGKPAIPVMPLRMDFSQVSTPKGGGMDYNPFKVAGSREQVAGIKEQVAGSREQGMGSFQGAGQMLLWEGLEQAASQHPQSLYVPLESPSFQYQGKYIVTHTSEGLMLVDQHRAHVTILYDRYLRDLQAHKGSAQGLLFPEVVQYTKVEQVTLSDILTELEGVGFDLTDLGGGSYSVNGIPSGFEGLSPARLLHDLIYDAMENVSLVTETMQSSIALTLAKAAAIVYGQILTQNEIDQLLHDLFRLKTPRYTPDGHVVYFRLEDALIEKEFK